VNLALLVAAASLSAGDGSVAEVQPAAAPTCQSYTRASPAAPEIVRAWLATSRDDRVLVCMPPPAAGASGGGEPVYSGESRVRKNGGVCSYATHLLARTGAAANSRLARLDATEAIAMTRSGDATCPPAHDSAAPEGYTMTYDLTPATFESLLSFWDEATGSAQAFDRNLACCGVGGSGGASDPTAGSVAANALRARLRAAIVGGRVRAAAVTRIVRVGARSLHRRYALFIPDPDARPAGTSVYVIYAGRFMRGRWHITGISDVAP
jgi:hypothetical protein